MLRIFNTLAMRKDELPSASGQEITVFVCGPTVYDYAHLGHARTYLTVDLIVRYLRYRGYRPRVVMNITDIDERIIKKSVETGTDTRQTALESEKLFLEDMNALGIDTIDRFERATDHIPEIIKQIDRLTSSGYAYETETGVYFDVSKSLSYGQLSRQSKADLKLRRLELCSTKRHPEDFSLWRKFDDGPLWDSPWGRGRPGWHIEDTAIAMKHLGSSYDMHVGGVELVFPHHDAEMAQGEALTGRKPYVKYWVHTGMLNVGKVKMSKSLGNVVRIRDALAECSAEELRFLFASSHYRKIAGFSKNRLLRTRRELRSMRAALRGLESCSSSKTAGKSDLLLLKELSKMEADFVAAMDDDLDAPKALQILSSFLRNTRAYVKSRSSLARSTCESALGRLRTLTDILGILVDQ